MKKIVILSNHHAYTYNFRKEIIQELLDEGYQIFLVLPYGEKVEMLKEMGCKFIDLPLDRRGINPITDMKLLVNYYQIIKRINPDAVLSYTVKPNIYGGIVCRLQNIPFFPNVTGLGSAVESKSYLQKVLIQMYKFAFKKASCIFFQNEENQKFFQQYRIVKGKYKLIPGSGVNLEKFKFSSYPEQSSYIKILFIGRIMKDKGIEELIEAAKIIKSKRKNVLFDAVGFYEKAYATKAKKLNESKIIRFHGVQDDVQKFIKESNVVILPSYHEGMANVLLEASSIGRPIIASSIPGCKETFDEGVTGFGIKPKNVESIVKVINKFIDLSYEKKKMMGISARKKMETKFDRKEVVSAYITEIEKALKKES